MIDPSQPQRRNLSSATSRLISMILKLTPEEIFTLLDELEEKEREKQRRSARIDYFMEVDFVVEQKAFKGYINNLSTEGVYIETKKRFLIGTEITLTFILPDGQGNIKAIGRIVRTDAKGMGVTFHADIKEMLAKRKAEFQTISNNIKHRLG